MSVIIRAGNERDMAAVLELLKELAVIKKQSNAVTITIYDLIRDGFSKNKIFKIFVAVNGDEVVGFALFCNSYSASGKSVVLEDIFVNSENKNSGIGLALFSKFLEYAKKNNIHRLEWGLLEKYEDLIKLAIDYSKTLNLNSLSELFKKLGIMHYVDNNILIFGFRSDNISSKHINEIINIFEVKHSKTLDIDMVFIDKKYEEELNILL